MNPKEDKFRQIKTTNKTLQAKVFNIQNMIEYLTSIGYQQVIKINLR